MKNLFTVLIIIFSFKLLAETPSVEDIQRLESFKLGEDISEELNFLDVQTTTLKSEED